MMPLAGRLFLIQFGHVDPPATRPRKGAFLFARFVLTPLFPSDSLPLSSKARHTVRKDRELWLNWFGQCSPPLYAASPPLYHIYQKRAVIPTTIRNAFCNRYDTAQA